MALTQVDGGLLSPTNGQFYGFKNRIINGAMVIDQRNAGASTTPTDTAGRSYALDRWSTRQSQASKFSIQQSSTAPVGFINSSLITSLSAYSITSSDQFVFIQVVEGLNASDLAWGTANAATVTLSFQVRSSLTGTFGGSLRNSAADRSYPFSYTINAANTFETKTVTIAGDTSGTWLTTNGIGVVVGFGLGVGSTLSGTAGAWAAANYASATGATSVVGTNGATFYITGVQLEKGSTATSFDYRPYGTELALCQRYCQAYTGTSVFGVSSTGFYGDANSITQMPSPWLNGAILRSPLTASLTMVGTQGTDWAITTSGGTPQTGFTLSLSGGVVIGCSKTGHGLTPSNTFAYLQTSSGKAIVTSEL
jgi:hypothetical protein